jgi:hypothetical protein
MTYLTLASRISTNNSTSTVLNSLSTYTGVSDDVHQYNTITITIKSDKDSENSGVSVQFSSDGTNWDVKNSYSYIAMNGVDVKTFDITCKYLRVVYINGSDTQTEFRLQTIVNSTKSITSTINFSSQNIDVFGRLRTSNVFTVIDVKNQYDKNPLLIDELTIGTGIGVYNSNEATVDMNVTTAGDSIIRQTRRYLTYQPGKSFHILCSGVLNSGSNDPTVTSRVGIFDSENGIYFENSDALYVVKRSYVTGSVVNTAIAQSSWNIDKMDGSGTSGITIDVTKIQIFVIDLQWLASGIVKVGIAHNGIFYYVHQFYHSNLMSTAYMTRATLPIRYELSTTANAGSMKQICASCMSEGGYTPIGRILSVSNNTTPISVGNTETPLLSIRLASSKNRVTVLPTRINIISTSGTNANGLLRVRLFQGVSTTSNILTGSNFVSAGSNSAVEYDTSSSAITITDSYVLYSCYISGVDRTTDLVDLFSNTSDGYLTSNISGDSDYLVITGTSLGANISLLSSVVWNEME